MCSFFTRKSTISNSEKYNQTAHRKNFQVREIRMGL